MDTGVSHVRGRAKDIRSWIADAIAKDRSRGRDVTSRLLAGVDPDERQAIVARSRRQTLHPSQVLFQTGERAEQLFVLRKGRVQFGRLSSTGREVAMGILGPGDVLGLACLLPSSTHIGTAEALDRGEVQVWSRHVIQRFAHKYPQVQKNVLQIALGYVAEFADRLEKLASGTAEQRLSHALTSLGVRFGTPSHASIDILIKNEQLASLADVSPFTVSRLLKQWERAGVISKSRGIVRILSPEHLLLE
jgi:CRP-like cAMP-binding protein